MEKKIYLSNKVFGWCATAFFTHDEDTAFLASRRESGWNLQSRPLSADETDETDETSESFGDNLQMLLCRAHVPIGIVNLLIQDNGMTLPSGIDFTFGPRLIEASFIGEDGTMGMVYLALDGDTVSYRASRIGKDLRVRHHSPFATLEDAVAWVDGVK